VRENEPLLPRAAPSSFQPRRTRLVASFLALAAVACSCAVVALLVVSTPQRSALVGVEHGQSFFESVQAQNELEALPEDMRSAVDSSVDPCEDFYTYACGSWDSAAKIPDDKTSWLRSWDVPAKRIEDEMQKAVEKDDGIVGTYYASCMNTDKINELGNKPVQPWLKMADEVTDMQSLTSLLAQLGNYNNGAFFGWSITGDSKHPEKRAFYLGPGGTTLPDQSFYMSNDEEMIAHRAQERDVIEKLLVNAGVDPVQARKDAYNVLAVETRTSEFTMKREDARDATGKRVTREELKALVPLMHWDDFFSGLRMEDVGIEDGPAIVVHDEHFFRNLGNILTNPNPQAAQLNALSASEEAFESTSGLEYTPSVDLPSDGTFDAEDAAALRSNLRYMLVSTFTPVLPEDDFAEVLKPLFSDLYGIKERPARWKKCYHATEKAMGGHMSKLYVDTFFPDANRDAAKAMLQEIRETFKDDLKEVSWMDDETREVAKSKLDQMVFEVAYPTEWPEWCDLDTLHREEFLENYVRTEKCKADKERSRLHQEVDRREWQYAGSTDVNAYYSQKVNGLFIPAAVLDPPFFDAGYPSARNYGSIGAVLGHEMTHGFDDQGRKFDALGRRHAWWNDKTVLAFEDRAQCIRDQYGAYTLHGKPVNGKLTLGEDIADLGGLKMAHRAWGKAAPRSEAEDRVFFLAFAQTWCGVERKKAEDKGLFDSHAPRKWRVRGTLSDMPAFAHAYKCPEGSPMNPGAKRCSLW